MSLWGRRWYAMAVYLITYDLHNGKNSEQISEKIGKLGDCIKPLKSFWLVNTALSFTELYNYVVSTLGRDDMFYISAISSPGMGRLDMEDTNWIKNRFFIPVTPAEPSGNPKGPMPVQNSPPVRRPLTVGSRQQYPRLNWD